MTEEGDLQEFSFASPCRDSSSDKSEEESNQHCQEILKNVSDLSVCSVLAAQMPEG